MDNIITSKMVSLAKVALSFFEKKERSSGVSYWTTKEECPDWVSDIICSAHGDFLPDDFRYKFIVRSLYHILEQEGKDIGDAGYLIEPDIYTRELLNWLSSHLSRVGYCDEVAEEVAPECSMIDRIAIGQQKEMQEVFYSVAQSLSELSDEQ